MLGSTLRGLFAHTFVLAVLLSVVACSGGSHSDNCNPPPVGMVGWWPGDGNGTDLVEGDTAVGADGATFAPGLIGQAFALDGLSSYFSAPDDPELNPTAAITVSAWVKRSAFVGSYDPVVKKAGAASGYALEFEDIGRQERIKFWVYLDSVGWIASVLGPGAPVPLGSWTHLAGVFDGAAVRVYVDGVEASSAVATGAIVPSTSDLELGRDPSNTYRHYSGLIDDAAVYGRALSASEIKQIAMLKTGFCP